MHFIKNNFIKHQRTILLILLFLVVGTMTIGYASFQTILTLGGTITLPKLENKIYITNVEYNVGENVIPLDPVINDNSIVLTNSYSSNIGSSTYIVAIFNYTEDTYIYNGYSISNECDDINLEGTYTVLSSISNIEEGDEILSGESKEIIVRLDYSGINVSSVQIISNIAFNLETNPVGNLSLELLTEELNYSDSNPININVVNTYTSLRYVEYRIDDNNFELVDSNGNALIRQRYDANYMNSETIYIRLKEGSVLNEDKTVSLYAWVNGNSTLLGMIDILADELNSSLPQES